MTQVNWKLCALCQTETTEKLINPQNRKQKDGPSGYVSLAQNLEALREIDQLPEQVNIEVLDDGSGIESTITKNAAIWHKSCRLLCNSTTVKRAQKRKQADSLESQSPVKTRLSLGATGTDTQSESRNVCFFCDESGGRQKLHKAETKDIDSTVRECAIEMRDSKLLAKLATGDMVAIDAMYHLNCLTELRNRLRLHRERNTGRGQSESLQSRVLGELVAYIEETHERDSTITVFKLSDISKLYSDRMEELGDCSNSRVHTTRLKERLLMRIPGLRAQNHGREVLLSFDKDIGNALNKASKEDGDTNALHLVKAAQIIRKEIFEKHYNFDGSFQEGCEEEAVSDSLKTLMSMIISGANIKEQSYSHTTKEKIAIGLSEIVMFNCVKNPTASQDGTVRHNKDREAPLPIYLSLLIHAQTRKRDLIDRLYSIGLCVSYDRLMTISSELANKVTAFYEANNIVCPPNLKKKLFNVGAVDKPDHNPSSRTAKDSFHGTAVTLMQFPTPTNLGESRNLPSSCEGDGKQNVITPLPPSYTQVPAVTEPKVKTAPSVGGEVKAPDTILKEAKTEEYVWLKHVDNFLSKGTVEEQDNLSWAAYHASKQQPSDKCISNIALLPLFNEQAHSASMIMHAFNVVNDAIDHLYEQQTPVIAMDQPLYALAKCIQWTWPESHGEKKVVVMLGGLHIEMNLLKLLGDWLKDSGWTAALVRSEITTRGRADSILKGSHVTRSRYAHQATAASLYILLQKAYKIISEKHQDMPPYDEWYNQQCQNQPQFKYWALTLDLELNYLEFVRSIREGNFDLYVQTMGQLAPWLFALDHTNYARWLPVHIRDMATLSDTHPDVYREFSAGHFVIKKTSRVFSCISIDQAHEQVNETIKGDGGAVGLTENPQALHRWMVAGPEISRTVTEFELNHSNKETPTKHHEQTPATQKAFGKDVKNLVSTLEDMGNPFLEDTGDLLTLDTKRIVDSSVVETVNTIEQLGQQQHDNYVKARLVDKPAQAISDTVKKNNLPLFTKAASRAKSKEKTKIASLKSSCDLFARLYISCQARQGNLDEFFQHENQPTPPAISDMGQLRTGDKGDLLKCLPNDLQPMNSPVVDARVFDGAAVVHMLQPKQCKTFSDYADMVFVPYMLDQLHTVGRIDIVWDRYIPGSLKEQTRDRRGQNEAERERVLDKSPIPENWKSFLRDDKNKVELFEFLAHRIERLDTGNKIFISTKDQQVVCSSGSDIDLTSLQPCHQEEADTRIFLHIEHCRQNGARRICI